MFSPLESYKKDLVECNLTKDPMQEHVVHCLNRLFLELETPLTFFEKAFHFFSPKKIQGIYLWGGVGRGKTYLVDLFFDCLTTKRKLRLHYHHFMAKVHSLLTSLTGVTNPLKVIAKQFASNAKIICFDEFFVSDIGDAMILAGLLEELYNQGVVLVMTSNVIPEALYADGLQRSRFLPAIELIYKNQEVIHLDSVTDYRMLTIKDTPCYYHPLGRETRAKLEDVFHDLVPGHERIRTKTIDILDRDIHVEHLATSIVWFNFTELCETNRSQLDYIEIARCFHTIFLSEIPLLTEDNESASRRFISLIDELYERKVNLFATFAADINNIYQGNVLKFEFKRTVSRLVEMQSREYLMTNHKS